MAEAAAHAAAIAQAIKASGVVVRVDPVAFMRILNRVQEPRPEPLLLPGRAEVVEAKSIWVPT